MHIQGSSNPQYLIPTAAMYPFLPEPVLPP